MKRWLLVGTALLVGIFLAENGFAASPTWNATGVWTVTDTDKRYDGNVNCTPDDDELETSVVSITQAGDTFTVTDEDGTSHDGTVDGSTYTMKWSETDDDATIDLDVTFVLADDSSGTGTTTYEAVFTADPGQWCSGETDFDLERTQASGTYSYDAGTGTLEIDIISTSFPQDCGPEVGTSEFKVSSISKTTMTWNEGYEDEMTWTRDSGTAGNVVGTWALSIDGIDAGIEVTINEDGSFSVVATSNFECDADQDPEIDVSPTSNDYGSLLIGSSSALSITISNTGTADLQVSSIALGAGSSSDFAITSAPSTPTTVEPGASVDVEVTYSPSDEGPDSGTLQIQSDDDDESLVNVSLSGNGQAEPEPEIDVSPTSNDYGSRRIGTFSASSVTISNTGTADLHVSSIALGAGSSSDFAITSAPSTPTTVEPGASVDVEVTYSPSDEGADAGTLEIASNDDDEPLVIVELIGNGYLDEDHDGVPDQEEMGPDGNDPTYDTDLDGKADWDDDDTVSGHTRVGNYYVSLVCSKGTLSDCDSLDVPPGGPAGVDFPYGLLTFKVNGLLAGDKVDVTLYYRNGPTPTTYHKYHNAAFYEFVYDGTPGTTGADIDGIDEVNNTLTLHFVEGEKGDHDLDPTTITDPSAPAVLQTGGGGGGGDGGGGGGGGGCFISTVFTGF